MALLPKICTRSLGSRDLRLISLRENGQGLKSRLIVGITLGLRMSI